LSYSPLLSYNKRYSTFPKFQGLGCFTFVSKLQSKADDVVFFLPSLFSLAGMFLERLVQTRHSIHLDALDGRRNDLSGTIERGFHDLERRKGRDFLFHLRSERERNQDHQDERKKLDHFSTPLFVSDSGFLPSL